MDNENNNPNNKNKGCGVIVAIIIVILILISVLDNSDSPSYSNDYYTDDKYKSNVDHVADVYGESPEVVDRKIQAVIDAMNK